MIAAAHLNDHLTGTKCPTTSSIELKFRLSSEELGEGTETLTVMVTPDVNVDVPGDNNQEEDPKEPV